MSGAEGLVNPFESRYMKRSGNAANRIGFGWRVIFLPLLSISHCVSKHCLGRHESQHIFTILLRSVFCCIDSDLCCGIIYVRRWNIGTSVIVTLNAE